MSLDISTRSSLLAVVRSSLAASGAFAIFFGAAILVWPQKTAFLVTAIIASFLIVRGVIYAGIGIFTPGRRGLSRTWYLVLGGIFVIAGLAAFVHLAIATHAAAIFVAVLIGVTWILEGAFSLFTLRDATSPGWSVLYAILSLVAGITMLVMPGWGAPLLWVLLGIAMIVLGVVQIVRAISFGSGPSAGDQKPRVSPTNRRLSSGISSMTAEATSAANSETL